MGKARGGYSLGDKTFSPWGRLEEVKVVAWRVQDLIPCHFFT